jgi:uncharacterized damage-inducible protein DinB
VLRFADVLLAEFDREAALTRRVMVRAPDDRFSWRPHDRSMTLGRLVTHLAELAGWGASVLTAEGFDLADRPPTDRVEPSLSAVLVLFDANVRTARTSLLGRTDGELLAPWTLRRDGQDVFTLPRLVAARTLLLQHAAHHRGQLSVYLRLLDVPLPPLYGPTADEGNL